MKRIAKRQASLHRRGHRASSTAAGNACTMPKLGDFADLSPGVVVGLRPSISDQLGTFHNVRGVRSHPEVREYVPLPVFHSQAGYLGVSGGGEKEP